MSVLPNRIIIDLNAGGEGKATIHASSIPIEVYFIAYNPDDDSYTHVGKHSIIYPDDQNEVAETLEALHI